MAAHLTPVDVAREWQCSAETVRRLCRTGELRALQIGDLWRISPAAVAEYEARHTTRGAAPIPASQPAAATSPAPLVYLDGALPERWWEQEQATTNVARPATRRGGSAARKSAV